jgi:S1-C subfamily serine protease
MKNLSTLQLALDTVDTILVTAALSLTLTSCASHSTTYVNLDGNVGTCATSGVGIIGATTAADLHERCTATAAARGLVPREQAGSIGIVASEEPAPLRIANVIPGSPADRAGIKPGDVIVAVDDKSVSNWSDARRLMFGLVNTPVALLYRSAGVDKTVQLVRSPFINTPRGM